MPSAFEESQSPIFIVDIASHQIVDANPFALHFSGYAKTEIKTLTLKDLHPAREVKLMLDRCATYRESGRSEPYSAGLVSFIKKDKSSESVHAVCHVIRDDDRSLLYLQLLPNKKK